MESPSMIGTKRGIVGSAFLINGMSSGADPMFMDNQSYRSSMNTLNRGGVVRTRPGYQKIFDLPAGKLQGLSYFKPLTTEAYLVFAVSGLVYASQFPFVSYFRIPNVQFYASAKQVFFCQCVQAAQLKGDGTVEIINPIRVLVMQDGQYTRAAYWDGANSGHLDPSVPATFQTVIDTSGACIRCSVTYGGTGYDIATPPTLTFQPPSAVAGEGYRTATGHVVVGAGKIQEVVIDDIGAGYAFPPAVSVSGQKLGPPLGGPMAWSGGRLWVAQDNKVLASDISNPLGWSESLYATGGGYFLFPEPVTALAEIPSFADPNLVVFTRNTSSILQSSITIRNNWQLTQDFQSVMFPGVGCTSHWSVVARFGELWWMTDAGYINFNAAQQSKITSYLVPQDVAMAVSKFNINSDLSMVAGAQYENFLLVSVPYADKYNRHTWVYDQAVTSGVTQSVVSGPYQGSTAAWSSYWTGTRPVQWASGPFNGVNRIFHVSLDYDGTNRLWEAFVPDRTDNGSPISAFLETKLHSDFTSAQTGGIFDLKRFIFAEVNVADILGTVNLVVSWAGTRGLFKELATFNLAATQGSVVLNVPLGTLETYRSQVRRLRTPEVNVRVSDPNSAASIEAPPNFGGNMYTKGGLVDDRDIAFSLLFSWSGQMGVRGYRIVCDQEQEPGYGGAPVYEYDPRILSGDIYL